MSVSKSTRFVIFARDGFTCQYCGRQPPATTLEVDHIFPVSKGGTDELLNLITSCFDCNRGKSDRVIGDVSPRPDANIELLRVKQEIAEAEHYLKASAEREKRVEEVCDRLRDVWTQYLTSIEPSNACFLPWIRRYGAEEIEESIKIANLAYRANKFSRNEETAFKGLVRYVAGVLRNRFDDVLSKSDGI